MKTTRLAVFLVALCLQGATLVLADGMVFSAPEVHAKIEIPNQQALIQFGDGVEQLVIETSFLGEGTNFAWVVPLPSVPEVEPVSKDFFPGLQQVFQPRLIHEVHSYYIGFLFVCGLAFLAWRSFKDEVSWINDLPVCALLVAGVWFFGKSWFLGLIVFGFVVYVRIFTRSTANLTLVLLVGIAFSGFFTFLSSSGVGLIQTLGSDAEEQNQSGVDVLSVQHAGVFDSTTIRSSDAHAVIQWLEKNGYNASAVSEPVVSRYVKDGWVFVASKLRRDNTDARQTSIHPLAFKFSTSVPVYPMKLTAIAKSDCVVDLYVFGDQRAGARHFSVKRCDHVAKNWQPEHQDRRWNSWLSISDPEVLSHIGHSAVGTKLSTRLSPTQMDSDVEIKWNGFWEKGAIAYSNMGALTVTLNVVLILVPLIWISVGACRGSWGVDEKFIRRWRWRLMFGALVVGMIVFLLLPKVPVTIVQRWTGGD